MEITWDPDKAKANYQKHGVRFSDAEFALFDPYALTQEDESAEGESRYVSIGRDVQERLVIVVYTYRGNDIRLISARKATRKEIEAYEKGI